jgi:hypothetical protein
MGKLLALFVAAVLQPVPDPLLARFAGQWSGEGTVLEMPASVKLTWEWTLGGQFLRLTFVNQMGPSRRFEGHAYYRALGDGHYRGTWFDNSGMIRPSMPVGWTRALSRSGELPKPSLARRRID